MRVLNVGCGNSDYGTDRIDIYKTKTTTKVFDIEKGLPYEDCVFDEVYSNCVLEHLKNLSVFIDDCYRVLKVNGEISMTTDYAGYLPAHLFKSHEHSEVLKRAYEVKSFGHKENKDLHYHYFVASHLTNLFKKFNNCKITYILGGRNWVNRFLLNLLPNHIGAVAIKIEAIKEENLK